MAAAVRGYRMVLIMPENQSLERRQVMKAYGAELILVSRAEGMEGARDLAERMQAQGTGKVVDQFGNDGNWTGHSASSESGGVFRGAFPCADASRALSTRLHRHGGIPDRSGSVPVDPGRPHAALWVRSSSS
jgi:hypothetical protein